MSAVDESQRIPPNLPEPVVFGPSFPQFTMATKDGRQRFESRTNQNLFLSEWDFNESGTFTMARLLRKTATQAEYWRLIWDEVYVDDAGKLEDWRNLLDEPDWDASEAFMRLLGFCKWEPEERFFREWARAQFSRGIGDAWIEYRNRSGSEMPLPGHGFGSIVDGFLDVVLDFPALIPETWLNYPGPEKTAADEQHLAENPQRVDFVFFAEGKKGVIEIDGPSHYADWVGDSDRYIVNEERYAKNLAIERSLRRQGWEIHRFANVEVMRASGDDFVRLITSAQLPGLKCKIYPWTPGVWRPRTSGSDLYNALYGDVPF
ncbi:MAG TPA: hypothetical protein VLA69_04505 [Gaiellaceae bacterium]|nr:hypothetical protein [Gaiellaceae bacterium]